MEFAAWVESLKEPRFFACRPYLSYRKIWERVEAVAREHGQVVEVRSYGSSVRGEPLWCVNVRHPHAQGPGVLVLANLHAMEHLGVAAAVALLERATDRDEAWTKRPLHLVPVANPDGFLQVEKALAKGRRSFLRKNANGVDLNRNFPVYWSRQYYVNRCLAVFFDPGPAPLSEPETRAIDGLAQDTRPRFVVSLHAFGDRIYLPYAGSRKRPHHFEMMHSIATEMTRHQPGKPYRVVQLARRSPFFAARGAEIDHFYEKYGALSFLIEIGSGPSIKKPSTWTNPYRWFTPDDQRLEDEVSNLLPALDWLAQVRLPESPA